MVGIAMGYGHGQSPLPILWFHPPHPPLHPLLTHPYTKTSMKAVCWHVAQDVRVDNVPGPKILIPRDAIL